MRSLLGVVLLLSACALAGCKKTVRIGDIGEPVTIKVKEPAQGDMRHVRRSEAARVETMVKADKGKAKRAGLDDSTTTIAYTDTILEKAADQARPTRVKREYTTAEKKTGANTQPMPYAKQTVLIEKKGSRYTFTLVDGQAIPGGVPAELEAEFNRGDDPATKLFLPNKPVQPGDSWSPPAATVLDLLAKKMQLTADPAKTTCTARLLSTRDQGGKKFGKIEIKVEAVPTAVAGRPLQAGSRLDMTTTIDGCIDGTAVDAEIRGTVQATFVSAGPSPGSTVTVQVNVTTTGSELEVKPLQPPPRAGR